VLTLGGKGELGQATTQRIKVTLQPVNPDIGEDAQVTDVGRGPDWPVRFCSPACAHCPGNSRRETRRECDHLNWPRLGFLSSRISAPPGL
jgi:hypothetical protein